MVVPIEGKHSFSGPYGDHPTPSHCHHDLLGHVQLDAPLLRDEISTTNIPHLLLQLPGNSCQVLAFKVSYSGALLQKARLYRVLLRSYVNSLHLQHQSPVVNRAQAKAASLCCQVESFRSGQQPTFPGANFLKICHHFMSTCVAPLLSTGFLGDSSSESCLF